MAGQVHEGLGDVLRRIDEGAGVDPTARDVGAVLQPRRVHHGGEDRADMDVGVAPQFLPQARGEAAQAEFARRIGRRERSGRPAAERDVGDERAVPLPEEARQGRIGPVHAAEQVDLDGAAMEVEGCVLIRSEDPGPGIVDPDVDAPERLLGPGRQSLHGPWVGDVGRDHDGLRPPRPAQTRDLLQGFDAAGRQGEAGAVAREGEGGRPADPARGAGDHHDGVAEIVHAGPPQARAAAATQLRLPP
ncbi:hypothetical protein AEGHOMDF_0391 [Methylobacterium soli]|nr:hypothetical protein AEGHOMDF_0391 [Methylobacterium soli]